MNYIWLILFFLLPIGGQVYASLRTWQLLPAILPLRVAVVVLMAVAFVTFFVSMSGVTNKVSMPAATFLYEVGSSWLVILLYLVMLYGVLDLLKAVHILPREWVSANWLATGLVTLFMVGLFVYAYLHYGHKERVELTLDSHGKVKRPMRLVLISDVHLGYHNRRTDLHRWLRLIKQERPDAVLIAGDLVDGSIRPVREERMAEEFRSLGIPVYAIPGNHDYYTGMSEDEQFCREAGIVLLRDSVACLGGDIVVVGRDDRTNSRRKPLRQLMEGVDTRGRYVIEMDHQPYHLEEAQQAGVDFEFAGHTHYGQVWPLSWITRAIYEDAFGPLTKGNTQYWVSSGIGIWGPKFRIGTRSEYIVATVK